MNALQPFFLLIQRPLVLFGAVGWMIAATFMIGQLVMQGGDPDTYMDAAYLTVVLLNVFAGWVIGSCILELQQTTFVCSLPRNSLRLLPGFSLFSSLVVLAAVLLTVGASPLPVNGAMLFAVGMGAFATGASIRDPQSGFLTGLGIALFIALIATSGTQARLAREQPLIMVLLAALLVSLGLYRLFNRDMLRSRSLRRGRPVLTFSADKLARAETKRLLQHGPKDTNWRPGYLGNTVAAWLRAAWYETHGGLRGRALLKSFTASWGLFLILFIEAREHSAELGPWKSVCWVLHDGLMRSPQPPLTGEHSGAFILVAVFIVIGGASMALWRPVGLSGRLYYPLSRPQKSAVAFAGSFLDTAVLLLAVAPVMYVLGHLTGMAAGITPRFDYLPLFLRAILITLVMMPFVYLGALRMRSGGWYRDSYSMVGISVGLSAFSVVTMVLVVLSGVAFRSPVTELLALLSMLVLSRLLYRRFLGSHFADADLC